MRLQQEVLRPKPSCEEAPPKYSQGRTGQLGDIDGSSSNRCKGQLAIDSLTRQPSPHAKIVKQATGVQDDQRRQANALRREKLSPDVPAKRIRAQAKQPSKHGVQSDHDKAAKTNASMVGSSIRLQEYLRRGVIQEGPPQGSAAQAQHEGIKRKKCMLPADTGHIPVSKKPRYDSEQQKSRGQGVHDPANASIKDADVGTRVDRR